MLWTDFWRNETSLFWRLRIPVDQELFTSNNYEYLVFHVKEKSRSVPKATQNSLNEQTTSATIKEFICMLSPQLTKGILFTTKLPLAAFESIKAINW